MLNLLVGGRVASPSIPFNKELSALCGLNVVLCQVVLCFGSSAGKPGEGGGRGNFSFFLLKIGNKETGSFFCNFGLQYSEVISLMSAFSLKFRIVAPSRKSQP